MPKKLKAGKTITNRQGWKKIWNAVVSKLSSLWLTTVQVSGIYRHLKSDESKFLKEKFWGTPLIINLIKYKSSEFET